MLEELWNDAKVTKHDTGPAIKPKVVRQTNRKYEPEENTLEEIEKTLPKSDRTPVVKGQFFGKPFGRKATPKIDPKTGEKKTGELSTRAKKYAEKKQSDKKFVDKKIQERKAASKKAPAVKTGENKVLKGAKAAPKKTSIKKK